MYKLLRAMQYALELALNAQFLLTTLSVKKSFAIRPNSASNHLPFQMDLGVGRSLDD